MVPGERSAQEILSTTRDTTNCILEVVNRMEVASD